MEAIFNAIGGRKFAAVLIIFTVATVAWLALSKMDTAAWVELAKWLAITYLGANVGSDIAAVFTKPQPPAPPVA